MLKKFREGVVYPIPPAFKDNGLLDVMAIVEYLKFLRESGCKIVMTTAGTSKYNLLTDEDIKILNGLVAHSGMTSIIGLPAKAEAQLQDFVDHANNTDADAIMLLWPDRYYCDSDITDFFYRVADKSEKMCFFHGVFMRNAKGGTYEYTPQLVDKLKSHQNIGGMKEESVNINTGYAISKCADDFFVVIPAGGSCRRYTYCNPAGAQTFLGGIGNIWPHVENRYFELMKSENHSSAYLIQSTIEDPFMEAAASIGWHKFLRIILNLTKRMPSATKSPFSKPRPEEIKIVENCIRQTEASIELLKEKGVL